MGMSAGGGTGKSMSEINMTPMIDVLLVLLVIFMIAQPLLQKSIDIQLPVEEKSEQPSNPAPQIVLELKNNGTMNVNTIPVTKANIEEQLRKIYTGRPDKVLFVKAEDEVLYQDVIAAMDAARGAGVKVLGGVIP